MEIADGIFIRNIKRQQFSYGFFKVIYDENRGSFYQEIENPGSGDYTLATNFDGSGNSRVVITIVSQNTPTHINVNIA